jgi:hypothetical protein
MWPLMPVLKSIALDAGRLCCSRQARAPADMARGEGWEEGCWEEERTRAELLFASVIESSSGKERAPKIPEIMQEFLAADADSS